MAEHFASRIRNTLPELARLQRDVTAFLAVHTLSPGAAYAVELAVEELVSNVIRHGYADDAEHEIHLRLGVQTDAIELVIDDDGRPFDPNDHAEPSAPRSLEDAPQGGMGILLVKRMAGPLRYERVAGRNILTLRISR